MEFAVINDNQVKQLKKLNINRAFITYEQMDKVKEILDLNGKSVKELRAIRNGVVKTMSELEYSEERMATISGTTATIDDMIWRQGGEV